MEVKPAGRKRGSWEKGVGKAVLETINDPMISGDRNSDVSSSMNKGKTAMGKVKARGKEKEKAVEEEAGGVMEFIIPMMPSRGVKSKLAAWPVLIQSRLMLASQIQSKLLFSRLSSLPQCLLSIP